MNKHLIPHGTKVKFYDDRIGIVDGNDSETTEEFENINYFICPIEFTYKRYWSDDYIMLLRDDFEIMED